MPSFINGFAPFWPEGIKARAWRMAALVFFSLILFWEFFTPFNQFGEPLPLIGLEMISGQLSLWQRLLSLQWCLNGKNEIGRGHFASCRFCKVNITGLTPHIGILIVYNKVYLYTLEVEMRTNVVINDSLMESALKSSGLKTKRMS